MSDLPPSTSHFPAFLYKVSLSNPSIEKPVENVIFLVHPIELEQIFASQQAEHLYSAVFSLAPVSSRA